MADWVTQNSDFLSGVSALLSVASVLVPLMLWRWTRRAPAKSDAPVPAVERGVAAPTSADGIAVIPFVCVSRHAESDAYVADGLSCELISALSRAGYRRIAPRSDSFALRGSNLSSVQIAQKLGVRFVVHGSVHHDGERVRVVAELADTQCGRLAWSKSYERPLTGLLDVQDEVAAAIAVSIGGEAFRATVTELSRSTSDTSAWDLVQKARHDYLSGSGAKLSKACIGLVRKAIKLDPDYAFAHALLGQLLADLIATGAMQVGGAEQAEALAEIDKATQLGQRDPEVLVFAGRAWQEVGERAKAVQTLRRATEIAPLDLQGFGFLGLALAYGEASEAAEALTVLAHNIDAAPEHPVRWSWEIFSAIACLNLGRADVGLGHAQRGVTGAPKLVRALMYQASCQATLDQLDAASASLDRARAIDASFTLARFKGYVSLMAAQRADIVDRVWGPLARIPTAG